MTDTAQKKTPTCHMVLTSVKALRKVKWKELPSRPGVYWWYFPKVDADHLLSRLLTKSAIARLNLRRSKDGKVCLYCGMAKNLGSRAAWHAAQKLTPSALKSRFLSTLRFTLLALRDCDYYKGEQDINDFMDRLAFYCEPAKSRANAQRRESREFPGSFHYPLNIRSNRSADLSDCVRKLKLVRSEYRKRYL